jgi:hypothetical protein
MSNKAKRMLALLANQKHRNYLVGEINRADQDEPSKVGGNQEIKALSEMNELQEFENDVWSPGRE